MNHKSTGSAPAVTFHAVQVYYVTYIPEETRFGTLSLTADNKAWCCKKNAVVLTE